MPDDTQIDLRQTVTELRRQLDARTAERDEALEQQTAAAEVLRVINSSRGDLELVFETLLGTGARLCKAEQAVITLRNPQDGLYHYGASFGYGRDFKDLLIRNPVAPGRASLIGRTALEARVVHIEDAAADPEYNWPEALRLGRWRTGLGVPLLRGGAVVGTLALTRRRIEHFTNKQIELIKTFAAQAVIALENTRLLGELRESEERYGLVSKAVAEGIYEWNIEHNSLWVSSRLIEIFGFQGRDLTAGDWNDLVHPEDFLKYRAALRDCFKGITARLDCEYRVRHNDGQYRWIEDRGIPVRNASGRAVRLIGAVSDINARKDADEALREALEQQTATAEILGIINASPGNLTPVFEAILDKAHTRCGATLGSLFLFDGKLFRAAATHGYPEDLAERLREGVILSATAQLRDDSVRWVHNPDLRLLDTQTARAVSGRGGVRTNLMLPLRKDGKLLGAISCNRQEVRPFTEKEIALLENFAAQAVIAMENARLIDETREALERQTATSEILSVISRSPTDIQPVFEAIVARAAKVCEAEFSAVARFDGELLHLVAVHSLSPAETAAFHSLFPRLPTRNFIMGRAFVDAEPAHFDDVLTWHDYDTRTLELLQSVAQYRSFLAVPIFREGRPIGVIGCGRREVRPFTATQIDLVKTFADQAAIALENVRLFAELDARNRDLGEALEQQTATAEVLQVINSSPGDLAPVFDAMLEKALRLCDAAFGLLHTYDGERFRALAISGVSRSTAEAMREWAPDPGSALERIAQGDRIVHIPDVVDTEAYRSGVASRLRLVELTGARTALWVALSKDDAPLGVFVIYRKEVRPFTDKQIALVQNFAAQAVIAIENARLINETREALEQQTATAEVLQVINSSPGDLAPVFDAMLQKALSLCGAAFGQLVTFDGAVFRAAAWRGYEPGPSATVPAPGMALNQLVHGEQIVHIPDITADDVYRSGNAVRRRLADEYGGRTAIWVALRKDAALLGAFVIYRTYVRPFSDREISLLENFAAQAVIAIENARLITETREALEQQTATAEVLQVINSSPGDLAPVFDAMLEKAMYLCDAFFGELRTYDGERFRLAATRGVPTPYVQHYARGDRGIYGPGTGPARILAGERIVHIPDLVATEPYQRGDPDRVALVELGGARAYALAPLLKDTTVLGYIMIYRKEAGSFSEKQITLLQNFAAQAVIAMENARLLGELRERTRDLEASLEYQTATSDVLKAISRSTFALQPVLNTLVETAARLCSADLGLISIREEDGLRVNATFSTTPEYEVFIRGRLLPLSRGSLAGRAFIERKAVQIPDLTADPEFAIAETVTLGKMRTALGVPLMREGEVIGAISLARQRVESFAERQLELVATFADQAVIAIENTRLLTELRESLEQQQAIAEILSVINSSPGELQPVFEAIVRNARRLCGARFGVLHRFDGELLHLAACDVTPEVLEFLQQTYPMRPTRSQASGRAILSRSVAQIPDALDDPEYQRDMAIAGEWRSLLAVPMLRADGSPIGTIVVQRSEPGGFVAAHIETLRTFADQAVIAIDNARLLNEIRQRQAELRVTFDNIGDGVAMFDAELHLAAWNRNFQEMLDLPDALLAERPSYTDYIRSLADRGEFGSENIEAELNRRLEATDQQLRLERTRPDGRVIEVRRNAVPAGGFVLIYADITERKRAEAEIRAARDAAERAFTELQTAQASLLHAQKMAALGQLTAGIAHEIKNPLNFVNNFAGLSVELLDELKEAAGPGIAALDEGSRAEIDEIVGLLTGNLEKIGEHGRRADGIVKSMLLHSRGGSGDRQQIDLNALVDEALNLAYHGARAQDQNFNITMERDFTDGLAPIELVPQDVTRVFLNLIGNGFHAAHKRQKEANDPDFRPMLKVTTRDMGDTVEIRVRDNGTGILPEHRDKLFQPFFTTKPTGEGTGLGLSISYDIVTQQHGGAIAVDSEVGAFTEFIVRLPRGKQSATTGRAA
jgi:PAS domain S-box-containing protein